MKDNKIALRPYLEAVKDICRTLSKEQMVELVLNLAQDESPSGRLEFLDRIKTRPPGAESTIKAMPDLDQLLDDIQELKADIIERIEAIESGEYETLDDWDWEDADYDDEPELISDGQSDELSNLFAKADALFLNGDISEARILYDALFGLMAEPELSDYYLPYPDLDWREERARHARCVYETSDGKQRVAAFADAMHLDASYWHNRMENYETGAGAIKQVLDRSLDNWYDFSDRCVVADEKTPSLFFYNEILNGLKTAKLSEYHTSQGFKWAQKIGKKRVDGIVSNTHRGAYDRAAMVLGSLAEVFIAKGEMKTARNLFQEFCKQKYNRHTAFKGEVRSVIEGSRLLKTLNPVF